MKLRDGWLGRVILFVLALTMAAQAQLWKPAKAVRDAAAAASAPASPKATYVYIYSYGQVANYYNGTSDQFKDLVVYSPGLVLKPGDRFWAYWVGKDTYQALLGGKYIEIYSEQRR